MCTSLLNTALTAPETIEAGGRMQAIGSGLNALGDLAAGVTRARMSRADARAEEALGQVRAGRIRTAGERELGEARAAASASGVKLSSGSVMEAERSIVRNVEQDALSAIVTGQNRAASLRASAGYYQQAGVLSALDEIGTGVNTWKRTRRPPAPLVAPGEE